MRRGLPSHVAPCDAVETGDVAVFSTDVDVLRPAPPQTELERIRSHRRRRWTLHSLERTSHRDVRPFGAVEMNEDAVPDGPHVARRAAPYAREGAAGRTFDQRPRGAVEV